MNYCWEIDRTSNNHDDIQAMIIIQASCPRLVDRLLSASTTITHTSTAIQHASRVLSSWKNGVMQ